MKILRSDKDIRYIQQYVLFYGFIVKKQIRKRFYWSTVSWCFSRILAPLGIEWTISYLDRDHYRNQHRKF